MSDENEPAEILDQHPESALIEVGGDRLLSDNELAELEKRVEQATKIKQIILKVTKTHHWSVYGDMAYLEQSGCKAVASFIGLGIKLGEPKQTLVKDDDGSYHSYETTCTVTHRGREWTDIGTADSRDPFLSKGKPQSEVNLGNIKKKSVTNAMQRAIKGCLGIDFTKSEVEAVVGTLGQSRAINYKSKPKEEFTADDVELKNDMKKKIYFMCDKDAEKSKDYLEKLTAFKTKDGEEVKGKRDFDRISMKQWNFKKNQVNKDFADWEAGQAS